MWDQAPSLEHLQDAIKNPSHPIGMRMRAAYFLRQTHSNSRANNNDAEIDRVVGILSSGLLDERHGSLMRHEFAYVMGQMADEKCCDTLEQVLQNPKDCSMVRHEAAEALGAIGAIRSRNVLEDVMVKCDANDVPEVSDTCRLAINLMDWKVRKEEKEKNGGDFDELAPVVCSCMVNPYSSIDPAPAHPEHASKSSEELGDILCDTNEPIFDRYRAMFSLRNRGKESDVLELCRALVTDTSSALLRHEVAYVLGQLQHVSSIEALEKSLRMVEEHQMVRHESAEALGAIDGDWERVESILKEFCGDDNPVVKESCLVALDAADYWGHSNHNENDEPTAAQDQEKENRGESSLSSFVQLKAISGDTSAPPTKST